MILRIKPRRYYSRGKNRTFFEIQKLTFYGWDNIFHISGFLDFSKQSAEWSEEDEDMLNSCISSIEEAKENRYAYKETDGDTSYDHEIAWLESLRNRVGKESLQPHWKPSEEQMKAFKGYIEDFQERAEAAVGGWNNYDVMIRMYEQLKKLI